MRIAAFAAALLTCSAASLYAQVTNATGSFLSIDSCGGHLDIDEASGYLTCGNLTNIFYTSYSPSTSNTIYIRRTMVVPLAPAFFNAPILTQGPFHISGGAEFRSH